jgi:hypothetical protein
MSSNDILGKSRDYWEGIRASDNEIYGDYTAEQIAQFHIWALDGFEKVQQFFPDLDRETFTKQAITFWDHHKEVLRRREPEIMDDPAREPLEFSGIEDLFPWTDTRYPDIDRLGHEAELLYRCGNAAGAVEPNLQGVAGWANYLLKGAVEAARAAQALPDLPQYALKGIGVADEQAAMAPEIALPNMAVLAACLLKIAARELSHGRPENVIVTMGLVSDALRLAEKAKSAIQETK